MLSVSWKVIVAVPTIRVFFNLIFTSRICRKRFRALLDYCRPKLRILCTQIRNVLHESAYQKMKYPGEVVANPYDHSYDTNDILTATPHV